ncbi:hypothetical protein H0W26_05265 [Candidatus Dependentiae bacterium]|nr:hypothetical protein [Candidatus Dependentiae bacterium]
MVMIPRALSNLVDVCNACILSCKRCIEAADECDKSSSSDECESGREFFIEASQQCIKDCELCIKICEEMIIQFNNDKHMSADDLEVLHRGVKTLGECVRICKESLDRCERNVECKTASRAAGAICDDAIKACDEWVELCEKHDSAHSARNL